MSDRSRGRQLTTGESARLAQLRGQIGSQDGSKSAPHTFARLIGEWDRLHSEGVTWQTLALGSDVSLSTLGRWRRLQRRTPTTSLSDLPSEVELQGGTIPGNNHEMRMEKPRPASWNLQQWVPIESIGSVPKLAAGAIQWTPETGPSESVVGRPCVMIMTGDETAGANRLNEEVRSIRRIYGVKARWVERVRAEADEIARTVNSEKPTVLHLAFHGTHSASAMAAGSGFSWVPHEDLARSLLTAWAPRFLVLSGCSTIGLASMLMDWCQCAIGWPEVTDDTSLSRFGAALHMALLAGRSTGAAHTDACLSVAHIPRNNRPEIFGDESIVIFDKT